MIFTSSLLENARREAFIGYCGLHLLVNASAKLQDHSDTTFLQIDLNAVRHLPQLFYMKKNGVICLIVAKVVDDILIGGSLEVMKWFITPLKKYYKLGTITHMPGTFHFLWFAHFSRQRWETHNLTRREAARNNTTHADQSKKKRC